MKNNNIIIIAGEPYSVFFEIFFKTFKKQKIQNVKNPIILIASKKILFKQMIRLNYNFKINEIFFNDINKIKINNKKINILNVDFNFKKTFDKISSKSNNYINNCCNFAIKIIKKKGAKALINGPVDKKKFLKKKYPGMTEYFAAKTKRSNQEIMLIYNKNLSVSPITTHLPLKKIFKKISKERIIFHVKRIDEFYKKYLKKKPIIALTGLNPHCETLDKYSEEEKILSPAIKKLKKSNIKVSGPFPADTIFLKKNYTQYDVIVGMYHDQVLAPLKSLYGFNAINITIGLPFIRITVDHGPNNKMIGKNLSSPESLIEAINFAKKLRVI
tara:strand:+ start:2284 stop:3270 length:987 start_codon:yes stop_codon:yes gene_type:complete